MEMFRRGKENTAWVENGGKIEMNLMSCKETQRENCLGIVIHKIQVFDLRTNI